MKTKLLSFLLLLSLTVMAQTNLVPNGNFETWTSSSQPDNWYRYFSGLVSQSSTAQNGNSSTNMQIVTGTSNFINSEYFAVQAGKTYRVTLYHKALSGTFSSLDFSVYHKPGTFKEEVIKKSDAVFSTSEWRKVEFEYKPTVSENIEIDVWTYGTLNSEILVDNISVVDVADLPAQYTLIPNANFEKKLIALGIDSGVADGKVLTSSVQKVTWLEVSNSSITDLTGIQDFTALEILNIAGNQLTKLDISKNIALQNLYADSTTLTAVDLSANINLNTIALNNNKLTALDVTKTPVLKNLRVANNLIKTLDVTKNLALSTLECQINQLSSIDLSKNTELYYLSIGTNKLTTLDISKNPKITTLYSYENQLTSLNLKNGKNTAISTIALASNPLLTCILVDDVNYSNLNWETKKDPFSYFSAIDCSLITQIPDPKFEQKLIDLGIDTDGKNGVVVTSNVQAITSLDVSNTSIIDLTGIESFTSLTNLNVSNNLLKALDLSKNSALKTLNTSNNTALTCIQVADVAAATANWNTTKDVTTSFNLDCRVFTLIPDPVFEDKLIALQIDTDGKNGKVLTSRIEKVTSIDASDRFLTDLTGIQDFKALKTLRVIGTKVNKLDVSKNMAMTYLDCRANQITSLDLSKNVALINLETATNPLRNLDLSNNINLTYVDCSSNQLTDIDVSKNIALTNLVVSYNSISNLDLTNNLELIYLQTQYNTITNINFSKNTKLQTLNIGKNTLTSLDVSKNIDLVKLTFDNNQIKTLDLSKNTKLNQIIANNNELVNLNIKNGTNTLLPVSGVNFTQNPDLACIQVDDVVYATKNWDTKKDAITSYSSDPCPLGVAYTLIPDPKFEEKLIELQIDKDGKNGKIATLSVMNLTTLDVSNSTIADLTGIEDFTALITLDCNNNQLTTINIAQNPSLTNLNVSNNKLSVLSVLPHLLLTNLNCKNNEILTLDVSKNPKLTTFNASFNRLQNLDVSKNTALKEIDCASNDLYNLNVKNGNNVNMQNVNFSKNPNLLCIQVDDAAFSNQNWTAKDATTIYSAEACEKNYQYTLIPDAAFEDRLIALKIDTDGKNGKVKTESISTITSLSLYSPPVKIKDMTGIQDFKSLETFDTAYNEITGLDLSKNLNLKSVNCSSNKLITLDLPKNKNLLSLNASYNAIKVLDISQNTGLTSVAVSGNQLNVLDVTKNTALTKLLIFDNLLTTLDVSQNIALKELDASRNKLATIDVIKNTALIDLNISFNQLTSLDVSNNANLTMLVSTNTLLTNLDVSRNTKLTSLSINYNKVSTLDVSTNTALTFLNAVSNNLTSLNISGNKVLNTLEVSSNKIASLDVSQNAGLKILKISENILNTLDLSKNPALISLSVTSNQLTSLDLRNGKNTLITGSNLSLYINAKLYCVLVDDITYANKNWSNSKDAITTYNTECTGELNLPANNFTVETKGESCLGENNGEINIVAKAAFGYTATVNDKPYTFANNTLKVAALAPGVYKIKIAIPDVIFEQNFTVTIAKGGTITGKSSVTAKKVAVEITEGTAPFTVFVNGTEQFQTTDSNFSIELNEGGLIEVATAKACEGVYAKNVKTLEILGTVLSAYPNPTSGIFEIKIPTDKNEVLIELYNFGGQLVSNKTYIIENGTAKLNLGNQPSGIYAAKIYLETPEYIKIIKK